MSQQDITITTQYESGSSNELPWFDLDEASSYVALGEPAEYLKEMLLLRDLKADSLASAERSVSASRGES